MANYVAEAGGEGGPGHRRAAGKLLKVPSASRLSMNGIEDIGDEGVANAVQPILGRAAGFIPPSKSGGNDGGGDAVADNVTTYSMAAARHSLDQRHHVAFMRGEAFDMEDVGQGVGRGRLRGGEKADVQELSVFRPGFHRNKGGDVGAGEENKIAAHEFKGPHAWCGEADASI